MDGGRTTERQYLEYSEIFSTQRELEYDQDTDLHQRQMGRTRRETRTGFWSVIHPGLPVAADRTAGGRKE